MDACAMNGATESTQHFFRFVSF